MRTELADLHTIQDLLITIEHLEAKMCDVWGVLNIIECYKAMEPR